MSKEFFWLMLTIVMTGLMWIPYIVDRAAVRGTAGAMGNPGAEDKPQSPWAQRMMAAHANAVENLVLFAPLVLVAHELEISNGTTGAACAVYFWARLAHFIAYTLGIPVLRTLCWTVGWLALAALVLAIFKLA
jgi:uncharacterized MAPEG superfamily protein